MTPFRSALCVLVLLLPTLLLAQGWRYGSVYVADAPEGMQLQRVGGELYSPSDLPGFFPGMLRMSGVAREGLFWQASNAVLGAYYGSGDFNIERFEQDSTDAASARSRMILSMATGRLILDSRGLPRSAQVLIELPMGKIHINRALISLDISHDERTGIYDFRMISVEGSLRFTDNQGQQYFASETQLLSGVGSSYAPSLEVSDVTRRMREAFDVFATNAEEALAPAAEDPGGFARQMDVVPSLKRARPGESADAAASVPAEVKQRPIVIEFVPAAKPLVPFRGEVRPLSEREAALF